MTAPTEQFVDIAKRSQDAVTSAVRSWADTVQGMTAGLSGGRTSVPDAHAVVDQYFDFAAQVLDNQRRFAQTLVGVGAQATESMTDQAARATESVTARVVNATDTAAKATDEVADEAAKQGGSTARAAKNSAKT